MMTASGAAGSLGAAPLDLQVTARVTGDALLVTYALVNRTGQVVVSYDGARGTGDGEYPDITQSCYVSYAGNGVARILRVRPGPHPSKDETQTFMPAGSEIKPGETRRVQFRLPVPVKERSQFSPDSATAAWQKQTARRLELRIGWFVKTPATELKPLGDPNVWRIVKGASLADMRVSSAATDVTFDVLVRTDPQFIRM